MINFWIDTAMFLAALYQIRQATDVQIVSAGAREAAQLEASAKQNAPWTDRTGNARRTLSGFIKKDGESAYAIGVCGNMPYSPRLETGFGGRYAILAPTLYAAAPDMIKRLTRSIFSEL